MSEQSTLHLRQQQLLDFLLGKNDSIAPFIQGDETVSAATRLSIYHNAYRLRLREVIDTDHPILGTYLGDDLFEQMVTGYIEQTPSHYRSLRQFCDRLPHYLQEADVFNEHPQISELARFERLLMSAFDAADSSVASHPSLYEIPPEQWPELTLRFHPSLQLFHSDWNVVDIWQAIKAEQQPPAPENNPNSWALWRNHERLTEFRSITSLEQQMLEAFLRGDTLSSAAELIIAEVGETDAANTLLQTLHRWLESGWVQQLTVAQEATPLRLHSG
jgi:hypothetical protein